MEFRLLRADEIDARISQITEKSVMLLLYKDARCDQNILDETVGPLNWQRHHSRDNANCIVSVWDDAKKMWIEKEDTGTESNTEKEKGLASDSFKRACVNFGIGRELYTAPRIWFPKDKCKIVKDRCYDTFAVTDIKYDGRIIKEVTIVNMTTGHEITARHQKPKQAAPQRESAAPEEQKMISSADEKKAAKKAVLDKCLEDGIPVEFICGLYQTETLDDIPTIKLQKTLIDSTWEVVRVRYKASMEGEIV